MSGKRKKMMAVTFLGMFGLLGAVLSWVLSRRARRFGTLEHDLNGC